MNALQTILVEGFDCFWLGAPDEDCPWASQIAEKIFSMLSFIRRRKTGRTFDHTDEDVLDRLIK
jgi:hypothetical protein